MSDLHDKIKGSIYDVSEAFIGPARQQLAEDMIAVDEKGQASPKYLKALIKAGKISDEDAVKIARLLPDDLSARFIRTCMKANHPLKYRLGMDIKVIVRE
jgi:hypothetical protein